MINAQLCGVLAFLSSSNNFQTDLLNINNLRIILRFHVFWDINRPPNLGQTTRPSVSQQKKRTWRTVDFAVPADHKVKLKEGEKRDKYLDVVREQKKNKKTMEHEGDSDSSCNWCAWYNPQRIGKETGRLGNKRTSGDQPNYSIIKIGQNTAKSPRDLRRLALTQTPVENHQLTLMWKTLKRMIIIIIYFHTYGYEYFYLIPIIYSQWHRKESMWRSG